MDSSTISIFLGLICIVLWIIYRYCSSENIFKEAGIHYIGTFKGLIGIVLLLFYPAHELLIKSYKKNGKLYGQYLFGRAQLNVGDPDLIKQILVKDFPNFMDRLNISLTGDSVFDNIVSIVRGEHWKRIRTVLSPGFSTGRIKKMTNIMLDCAETLKKNIDTAASSGEPVEIKKFFGAFTMDAITSSAFGIKVDSHNDPDNQFIMAAKRFFTKSNQLKMLLIFIFSKGFLMKLIPPDFVGTYFFSKIILQIAEKRKQSGEARNDFMQLLIDALEASKKPIVNGNDKIDETQPAQNNLIDDEDDDIFKKDLSREKIPDLYRDRRVLKNEDEFVAQCMVFFIAGYEGVASTIAFAVYELALNEECQEKLITEIDNMLNEQSEKKLTYENIQSLKYLDAVISEVLRKYSPAPMLARIAITDCTLGESNIRIPKGTTIQIPVYAIHYDPEYYPNPEKFDPERFSPEEKASRNPYVYLPFGAGPRNCVAMRFALYELKLCLAYLLRHFRFHRCAKTEVPLKLPTSITQIMASEIFVSVEKRDSSE